MKHWESMRRAGARDGRDMRGSRLQHLCFTVENTVDHSGL